jgi:hypothetical protein
VRNCLSVFAAIVATIAAASSAPQTDAAASAAASAVTQSFDRPVAGARSPRNANYDIDVRLDHERRTLRGHETIRWRNITSQPATELQFHLYWNAWRNADSTWMRERRLLPTYTRPREDAWGSIDVRKMQLRRTDGSAADLTSQIRYVAPDDGNAADRTVISVPTGSSVPPGADVQIEIEWDAKIPQPFARTGYIDDYYFIAQWFPKMGVLEESGWNTHQFHSATEFYADYGVYDVAITVPGGFTVGASGRESGQQTERRIGDNAATTTYRFHEEDIHDFAWTASPRFLETTQMFRLTAPAGTAGGPAAVSQVEMRLLLQPEHIGQESRHFAATAAALKYYGEWFGPYPYDHITIVDPAWQSRSGGMEYPTLFTAGTRWIAPADVTTPESVTVHEAGHQFWYAIVGSNEFEHAWMDEGLNTFATARAIEAAAFPDRFSLRFFGTFIPWVVRDIELSRAIDGNRLPTYRVAAEADAQATPSFRYWPATSGSITYDKTALWLHTLERHLGWPVLQKIMSTYFERWKFRHPQPQDFFDVANEVSGQDLTWFFDQVYRSSNAFDYAVQELLSERTADGRYRTVVAAQRLGEATFPIDVVTTFDNGEQIKERWNGLDRRIVYTYERPSRAASVQIDPQRVLLLDVNYTNNSCTLQPRAAEAGRKWGLKWMVWLQDLMLTYGFFI